MPRINVSEHRRVAFKEQNIGHLILYCEGKTEKLYFEYFASIIKKTKFDEIKIEVMTAGGNSSRVLNYALKHLKVEENNRKYSNFEKYLVFDCDAPENIQEVVQEMYSSNFNTLLSNNMFEIWLLMHFEDVNKSLTKGEIDIKLSRYLSRNYKKANEGAIRAIIHLGDVEKAILNAERLVTKYTNIGFSEHENIVNMNPYTTVHILIKEFLNNIDN